MTTFDGSPAVRSTFRYLVAAVTLTAALLPVTASAADPVPDGMIAGLQRDLGLTAAEARTRLAQQGTADRIAAALGRDLAQSAWFDSTTGKLTVAVTDRATADRVRAAGAVPKAVARSHAELTGLTRQLGALARNGTAGVSGWGVDARTNSVVVTVHDRGAAAGFLDNARALGDAVRVVNGSPQRQQSGVVQAGDPWWPGNETNCSIGFAAVDSTGGKHFVTAGHCTNDANQAAYGKNSSGTKGEQLGTGNVGGSRSVNANEGDFGVVAVNHANNWNLSPAVNTWGNGAVSVNGTAEAVVGDAVCHSGNTTQWRCGKVTAVNQTVVYQGGPTIEGLTYTDACSNGGDSGGGYVLGSGTSAKAVGLHSGGGNPCGQSNPNTTFQPVNEALRKWNLTLYTNDAPPEFSLALSAASGSVRAGSSTTTTVDTATVSGSAQNIALAATGAPAGVAVTFNPGSVQSGGSSTATIATTSAAAAGTYPITVTGTGANVGHSATYTLTVTTDPGPSGSIVNGDFETGDLTGWTKAGTASTVTNPVHGGAKAALVGSTTATGESTLSQTFTAPTGAGQLSFWYRMTCPDTVYYDWATATLRDNGAGTTTTVLARTCATDSAYQQVTAPVSPGVSYTLTLVNHADGNPYDVSHTAFDDVTVNGGTPPTGGVVNGGYETGDLGGWTSAGTIGNISTPVHGGTRAARIGAVTPSADSTLSQTFTAPPGATRLSFWYKMSCPDTVGYAWFAATLKDDTSGATSTPQDRVCTQAKSYQQVSVAVTAGHSYTLTFTNHDDNHPDDPVYSVVDDVATS
ncbi:alpha-lytic protease prodomain-containing protein [Longispora urticae]